MVLKDFHIRFRQITLFIIMTILFSCEKPVTGIIKCSECKTDEPVTATLEIKIGYQNNPAVVSIYEGNLEDSILYESFFTFLDKVTRSVPVNKKYTLTAVYSLESQYIVVNSVYPRVLYDEVSCDVPCYVVYDKTVDLRLKYTK